MSSNIWNLKHPLRTGFVKLVAGKEKFGSVVKQGYMDKTVSVRVNSYHYNYKIGIWFTKSKLFHCHDEENYCKIGDKVVITHGGNFSKIKHYYVRNIILPAGR